VTRVVVTGMGAISPLGNDVASTFDALTAGRSAIRRLDGPGRERLVNRLGAPVSFDPLPHFDAPTLRMLDRVSQLALVAATQAVRAAGKTFEGMDRARAGVCIGTGMGGAQSADDGYHTLYAEQSDRLKPFTVLLAMTNAPASWIGIEHRLAGPNLTYSTACSSSAVAIGEAARRVARGEVDVMIAGGAEACLNFGTLKAWEALRTLATEDPADASASCKPFAKDRSGLVLGEGAAMLVLESQERAAARGAPILAELAGYGLATDAAHITRPSAEGQAAAIRAALADARMEPAQIHYINAHGTGTQANDGVETTAIKSVFGLDAYRVPVSSTKSMHGHLLGAAGALEMAICIEALARGVVPPTRNLRNRDPECDLDYVPDGARQVPGLRAAMSSSFAFGGTNAVLIVKKSSRTG
jgi:3-oxoacyl-[acyl-carrier-protein] synthase II